MKQDFYDVIINENDNKFAFYMFGINWKPEKIINDKSEGGYIVQKVLFKNNSNIHIEKNNKREVEYYEAWPVENMKVKRNPIDTCDDLFSCGSYYDMLEWLCKSLGETGYVEISTRIYWIGACNPLYKVVDSWGNDEVSLANGLKATLCSNCLELSNIKPVCYRNKFVHVIEFKDKEIIKNTLLHYYNKWTDKVEFIEEIKNNALKYNKSSEIVNEIINELR